MEEWRELPKTTEVSFNRGLVGRIGRVMELTMDREVEVLERHLPSLATIGSTAPFVGLFGTVWGIMNSFQSIAATKNTTLAVVAPGIAEALFATALGLLAAIPAVIAYNKLSGEVDRYANRLASFADEFAVVLSRELDQARWPDRWRSASRSAAGGRGRRRPAPAEADGGHQRHADGRRHAGAADRLHGHGPAADDRRGGRPAADRELAAAGPGRAAERHGRRQAARSSSRTARSSSTSSARARRHHAAEQADARIFVRGDRGVDYGSVMGVVGAINRAGFSKVALLTDSVAAPKTGAAATPATAPRVQAAATTPAR